MESSAAALPRKAGLTDAAKRAFFRSFFRLLLVFVAIAEWACLAWLLRGAGVRPPLAAHLVAPLIIFQLNRWVIGRRGVARGRSRPVRDACVRGYVAFAFTSIFCGLFLVLAGAAWPVVALVGTVLPPAGSRELLQAYLGAVDTGFVAVGALVVYGFVFGRRELVTTRLRVPVPGLPAPLEGLRIVHLSDLHIGQHLDVGELRAHVERVNRLDPDLVCITGDLVDRADTCAAAFPTLGRLRARHGVFVTLGNHDFYAGADTVSAMLRRLTPFTVLRNASVRLEVAGAVLTVVGVDDLGRDWARGVSEHPALPALTMSVLEGTPFVVLSHRPDCFPQAARLGASLMLAGHTHGGQLALPAWRGRRTPNLARFISRFDRGLYRDGDAVLYVSRGLGFTGQPIRLFTPREIACLELTRA